ncbi:MAG: PorV/PorQ family protein [Elusimicrobia bacterium]|nr:PorV/PorQ family protein [Candidatus Liberimonas magnetica]
MKNKSGIILVLWFALAGFASISKAALFSRDDAGTTSAQFLKLGTGARPVAMGEAFTGLADDINAIYWNPAGLTNINNREITAMRAQWFEDVSFNWAAYTQPAFGGSLGLGLFYLGSGDIKKYDNTGKARNESYSGFDSALSVSYARQSLSIPLGITVKFLNSKLEEESASGIAADIGLLKTLSKAKDIIFGLALQNIGTGLKYVQDNSPLPLTLRAGVSFKQLNKKLLLVSDLNFPVDNEINAHLGAEYKQNFGAFDLFPRVGFKTNTVRSRDVLSGVSGGFGISYNDISVNYAWVPYWELGATQRVDIGFKFSETKKKIKIDYSSYSSQYACVDCVNIAAQNIHFDFGNYSVKEIEMPILDTVAALIFKYDPYKVRISGHSDTVEDKAFGKDISFMRANFVMKYLVERGVPQDKIYAAGYGSDLPVEPNDAEAGRSKNRRVEFLITDNKGGEELKFSLYASLKEKEELINMDLKLGQSLFAEDNYDKAIEEFKKVLQLDPDNTEAKEYIRKAEDMKIGKKSVTADNIDKKITRMRGYFQNGQELFKKGKYRKSIKEFEKVLKIDPMHVKSMRYILRATEEINK